MVPILNTVFKCKYSKGHQESHLYTVLTVGFGGVLRGPRGFPSGILLHPAWAFLTFLKFLQGIPRPIFLNFAF